ncbi:potassium channel family protein [Candidatus Latescibacterota bacterium]
MILQNIKRKIYNIIEPDNNGTIFSKAFQIFIVILIVINVVAVMFETIESLSAEYSLFFRYFEYFSVIVFTIEYMLRLWVCTENKRFARPVYGRFRFALTPLSLIDILAISPFYLPMIISVDLRFIRILRLFRLSRLLKLGRYSKSLNLIGAVLKEKKEELVITVFIGFMLLIMSSSVMYYCENQAQPDVFSSIPSTLWWGVSTLTTVGYGDAYPVTSAGKFFASIIAFLGIGLFALPTAIIGSGFMEVMSKKKQGKSVCPHCGKEHENEYNEYKSG